jgi:hypothetical protein
MDILAKDLSQIPSVIWRTNGFCILVYLSINTAFGVDTRFQDLCLSGARASKEHRASQSAIKIKLAHHTTAKSLHQTRLRVSSPLTSRLRPFLSCLNTRLQMHTEIISPCTSARATSHLRSNSAAIYGLGTAEF